MSATNTLAPRLATRPIRTTLANGYRSTALMARLSTVPARTDAAERLCRLADRKPAWLYEARSKGRALPDERLDGAIVDGIRDGYVTPEVLADYYGDLFALYRAMMPDAHATFLDTAREKAEAIDAMAVARAVPTPENIDRAVREVLEDVVVSTAHAKALQKQGAA